MARFNYPEDFLNQTELFKDIKKKHDADAAASVLIPYLVEQGIDLNGDETKTNNAIGKHKLFVQAEKDAEDLTQDRNKLFDPVFDNMSDGFQFLKKLYRGNPAELGHWGAVVNGNAIVYPPDFLNRVELFKDYKTKHDSFPGGSSPLEPFLSVNEIELDAEEEDMEEAETKHSGAKQTEKDAEDLREERDNFFDPVMVNVRGMGQYLKGLYVKHPKHVGNWGYVIDDSPRDPKFRTATINPASTRTLTGVKLNSQVENTGTIDLLLHKGAEVGTEAVNLAPEMRFTVVRGWGTMTVENPDPTQVGEVGYTSTRQSGS